MSDVIISEVSIKNIKESMRFDSEFYEPQYIENEELIKNLKIQTKTIKDLSNVISKGIFYILAEEYTDKGIIFLRVGDIKNPYIDLTNITYITEEKNKEHKKTCLGEGDLVITKSGTLGNIGIVYKINKCNISQDLIGIKVNKNKINPWYLCAFLLSKYGKLQIDRSKSQQVQGHLTLDYIRDIKVPIFKQSFQERVGNLIKEGYDKLNKSIELYRKAEGELYKLLNTTNFEPTQDIVFETHFTLISETIRFDAEYYQPKYEQIIKILNNSRFKTKKLKEVVTISNKKIDPLKTPTKRFRYIPIAKIDLSGDINGYDEFFGWQAPSRARMLVKGGDVLVSSLSGSLDKIALIPKELDNSLATTGTFVIRSNLFYSEFLFLLFRTPIIKLQLEQKTSGAIMSAVPRSTFGDLLIPVIPKSKQEKIVSLIKEFFNLRNEAKKLVEQAKREVEKKIESGV